MKRIAKKIFVACTAVLIMTLLCVSVSAKVVASGECGKSGSNVKWSLDDQGTLTISGQGDMESNSYGWKEYDDIIKSVVIEEGVRGISPSAFSSCYSLVNVSMPKSLVKIGNNAFANCTSLYSVSIPENVTDIEPDAFSFCNSLTFIDVDDNNLHYSNDIFGALFDKNKTVIIAYPIGRPNKLYTMPESVKTVSGGAFSGCETIVTIVLGQEVDVIEYYAFSSCDALENVVMPNNATTIERDVFRFCGNLSELRIPDGITTIESSTFLRCENLNSIFIPKSVTAINSNAFDFCTKLKTVYYTGTKEEWNKITIASGNEPLQQAQIVSTIRDSGNCGANVKWSLDDQGTLTISGSGQMDNLGYSAPWKKYAFDVKNVIIKEGVTSIGQQAFYECNQIKNVSIPDSVTSIDNFAFYNCSKLESITIPDSVTTMGLSVFYGCTGLKNVVIPDGVTEIKNRVFEKCTNLASVVIPRSVIGMGDSVFNGCTSLKTVYFGGKKEEWNKIRVGSQNNPLSKAMIIFNYEPSRNTSGGSVEVNVCVNNENVIFEDQKATIINNFTLIPVRGVLEAIGAGVEWDSDTKTVTVAKGGTTVKVTINSNIMYVNGRSVTLEQPAILLNGRTLVPIRAICEAFGCKVDWDDATKTVLIKN